MNRRALYRSWPALLLGLLLAACAREPVPEAAGIPDEIDYNAHIQPILSDRCYPCHGPDRNARKADFRLDLEEFAKAPLKDGGHAIVPGKARRSELVRRITSGDPEYRMPPPESKLSLSEEEIALLETWIDRGAAWKPHWAFIPPERQDPPEVSDPGWVRNGIDAFVLARLEREGLKPSPEADPERLLRRVTLDLTGLPPTLEEIDAFLADDSPDAYEKVVDRLLASPAYGERMATEWLDVARYADTDGYQADGERRMWPWRDWVIEAFNKNLPFDDFVTWQLAGDLLPDPTKEQRLATAFNRNHMQTEEGGTVEEEFRVEYVADRTQTLGTAFLGLTMECARCHDHKFDPISQEEYYRLFAFFNTIDESGRVSYFTDAVNVPALLLTSDDFDRETAAVQGRIAAKEAEIDSLFTPAMPAYGAWLRRAAASPGAYTPAPQPTDAFSFDALREGRFENAAVPGRPGRAEEGVTVVPGRDAGAAHLTGDDGVTFPGVGVFSRSDAFSFGLWINIPATTQDGVVLHRTMADLDAGSRGYELGLEDGRLAAALTHMWPNNALKVVTREPLPVDRWVHVALTYDGSSRARGLKLYVDGMPAATQTVRDHLRKDIRYEQGEAHLALGARFRGIGFTGGLVDDLRVFDDELTALDVAQLAGNETLRMDLAVPPDGRTAYQRGALFEHFLAHFAPEYARHRDELMRLRREAHERVQPVPEIMVMEELDEPRPTYRLERGRYDAPQEQVFPGTPAVMPPMPDSLPRNRLGLARWLLDPGHPLTARVTVNRYWQLFFGRGLVATPEDFGSQGRRPTHPRLLDYLATSFIDSGWDVKALHRLIVTSATYRQSSSISPDMRARDPENALLARGPAFRLTAEMIRDNALAASGLLVRTVGGPSVRPYQPAGLWEEKSGARYEQDHGDALYRRSMYTFWKRTSPPPSMITFDAAERNVCVARRQKTSTPLQALVLLNDPQFAEAARVLAERVLREAGDAPDARLTYAFRLLTGRRPTEAEGSILRLTYEEQRRIFEAEPQAARAFLGVGEHPPDPGLDAADVAATAQVATAIMNFDETTMKR